jgi:hypothetical protein
MFRSPSRGPHSLIGTSGPSAGALTLVGAVLARLMDLGLADAMQRKRRKGAPLRA